MKNLCGESASDQPWVLSGDDFDFEQALNFALNEARNQMLGAFIIVGQMDMFTIYTEWNAAKNLLIRGGDLRRFMPGFFQGVRFTFLEGLICLKSAQTSTSWMEKRKWRNRAKKSMKMLRQWLEKGNVNVVHTLHLLTAEYHALNKKYKDAEESFKAAQTAAARTGFLQDRALSHELAGVYYMGRGDDYWAKHNINLALRSYMDWQAKAKAKQLKSKYPQFFQGDQ